MAARVLIGADLPRPPAADPQGGHRERRGNERLVLTDGRGRLVGFSLAGTETRVRVHIVLPRECFA